MKTQKIKISYWRDPEGNDFECLDQFKNELSRNAEIKLSARNADGYGSGFHEIVVEILNSIDFMDYLKDYIKDSVESAIKISLGAILKPLFGSIKKLFVKNTKLEPEVESIKISFRDLSITLYSIYSGSIGDVMDDIIDALSKHYSSIVTAVGDKVSEIYIPIFNKVDVYEVCAYRVKLNVDENIEDFSKEDYFKFWGVRTHTGQSFVYELDKKKAIGSKFYTQIEYDVLLEAKFAKENLG